jgi:hypothetical protein
VKTILLRIAVMVFSIVLQISSAEEQKSEDKLLTRYFWVPQTLMNSDRDGADKGYGIDVPIVLDGLEDNEMTRTSGAREFLEKNGVAFPPGSAAVFYNDAGLLGVKNTVPNILKIAALVRDSHAVDPAMLLIEVRVLEYAPDVETKLNGRGTFAELEAKIGESLKTVCASSVLTKSGQRAVGRLDSGGARMNVAAKQSAKTKAVVQESQEWPPPTGIERALLEVEPTLGQKGREADMQISFRYATPANSGQPTMQTEVQTNFAIKDGCLLVLKTFTVSDPASKHPNPRRYAVVVSFNRENSEGKTIEQIREETAAKSKRAKKS